MMTQRYFAAAVLLILAFLGVTPEGLLGLPFLLGVTDGEGGDEGGGNEGGGGDGAAAATEQLDLADAAADAEAAAGADPAAPAGTERWDDKMKRLRAEVAAETAAAAAGGGEGEGAGDPAAGGEGEGGGEGADPAAGDDPGAAGEGDAGKDEDGVVFVALPGRRPEDGDFEIPIDVEFLEALEIDPADVVERINQLKNGYAYRKEAEEIRTSAEAQLSELDGIYEAMAEDPAGFLISEVKPELRSSVVEELILELTDAELTAILNKAQGYVRHPDTRELAKTKAQLRRTGAEKDRLASSSTKVEQEAYTKSLRESISSIVPEATPKARADLIVRTAARELQLYAAQKKLTTLDPTKVPEILAEIGVLETFGLTLPTNGNGGHSSSAAATPPKKAAPPKPAAKAPAKPPAPKGAAPDRAKAVDVRDRLKRRKTAATTTPAGAGSATPPGFQKVPGEKHLDRRNRLARALGLPEKKEL